MNEIGVRGALTAHKFIVTGGSRGIGFATVKLLLEKGAEVAFCARGEASLEQARQRLEGLGTFHAFACDVSDPEALAKFSEVAAHTLGGLDGYVANVSGGAAAGEEGWQSAIKTDLMGTVRGCEAVLPLLASDAGGRFGGSIVIVGSTAATEVSGDSGAYGPVKAALIAYASQLGEAVGGQGIRVNSVSPGPIMVTDGFWGGMEKDHVDFVDHIRARHAAGRLGTPDEVANVIVFLLSNDASWVHRSNIMVDGGFSRRVQF